MASFVRGRNQLGPNLTFQNYVILFTQLMLSLSSNPMIRVQDYGERELGYCGWHCGPSGFNRSYLATCAAAALLRCVRGEVG